MYPAYPRHFFSLRGLVHICIPHTGTPCGRGLCHQGLTRLSWVLPAASALLPSLCFYYSTLLAICQALFLIFFGGNGGACPSKSRVRTELNRLTAFPKSLAVPIPLAFVPLLYHTLRGLSRGFLLFVRALPARLPPLFRCVLSPLDTLIVSQLGQFVKSYIITEKILDENLVKREWAGVTLSQLA